MFVRDRHPLLIDRGAPANREPVMLLSTGYRLFSSFVSPGSYQLSQQHLFLSTLFLFMQLQSFLQVSVFQIRADECPSSECAGASGCTNVLNVRDTPTVVDCGTMSLVSVTVESTAVCSCPGRDLSHQPCTAYPKNPCFNGGVCVDTQHGYR